jgi:hypothetical protein
MLESYLLGAGAVVALMLGWLAVQSAWSRAFPEAAADPDVLARRGGCGACGGCGCAGPCKLSHGDSTNERMQ